MTNQQKANYLRSIADYIELADEGAEVSMGFRFKVYGEQFFHKVDTLETVGLKLSSQVALKLADFVRFVQTRTGQPHGEEIVKVMEQYHQGLTTRGYLR